MDSETVAGKMYSIFRKKMIYKLRRFSLDPSDNVANQRGGITENDSRNIAVDAVSKIEPKAGDRILEIGCGTGMLGSLVSETGADYIGMDLIYGLVNRAQNRQIPKTCFVQGDALRMPFRDQRFSKIMLYSVILYLPPATLYLILEEISRVLIKGGLLLVGDVPDPDRAGRFLSRYQAHAGSDKQFSRLRLAGFLMKKRLQKALNMPGGGWYSPKQLLQLLEQLGFEGKIVEQESSLPFSHYRYDCIAIPKETT